MIQSGMHGRSINECRSNDCRSYECRRNNCRSYDCRSNETTPTKQQINNDLTPAKLQNMLTDLLNVFLNPMSVNSAILSKTGLVMEEEHTYGYSVHLSVFSSSPDRQGFRSPPFSSSPLAAFLIGYSQ